jgi:hypothetical protein
MEGDTAARLAAHWAAQVVAAAGWTLADHEADDSNGSLEWSEAEGALLGVVVVRGEKRARAGLRLRDLTLLALPDDSGARDELALPGTTLEAGLAWLAGALARILAAPVPRLVRPQHELPAHSAADGKPFGPPDHAALAELGRWFAFANDRLRDVVASTPAASPVRCWPHHFDIATLIRLDGTGAPQETARTIGVGMSPGDGSYAEPYWYVTPWPYPKSGAPAALPAGHWHITGWFGAVLTAAELGIAIGDAGAGPRVATFLSAAISACHIT